MKDRFYNPFDGSRKRSAPQPHKLKKDKLWWKLLKWRDEFDGYVLEHYKQLKEEE